MEIFANLPEKMKESSVISRFPSKDPSNDSLEVDTTRTRNGWDTIIDDNLPLPVPWFRFREPKNSASSREKRKRSNFGQREEGGERKEGEKTANSVHDDVEQTT